METQTKLTRPHWRIEEAGSGEPSDSTFIIVDPTADVSGILVCVKQLCTSEIRKVWIVFDTRCRPLQVQACLKVVRDVMPGRELIIRHADAFIIYLIGQLWRRMQTYPAKRR